MADVKRCTRCILPENFPGIRFDEGGVCNFCQDAPAPELMHEQRERLREQMAAAIDSVKGHAEYDCIVAFSGGKDSTYTLMHLVEDYGLRCMAVTVDNGFVASRALENCRAVTDALGVDFMLFRPSPSFMMNLYRKSVTEGGIHTRAAIKRASAICSSCINLINNFMVKLALQHDAPLIAGGYIGGQVPKDSALVDLDLLQREKMKAATRDRYLHAFGADASKFFFIRENLLQAKPGAKIRVINPMLTLSLTEDEIIARIGKLGWVKTTDTGKNSNNCQLNDLGIAIHFKRHGFNPYELEIAEQVRYGLMSRDEALARIHAIPAFDDLKPQLERVGIDVEQI